MTGVIEPHFQRNELRPSSCAYLLLRFPIPRKKRIKLLKMPLDSRRASDLGIINGALKSVYMARAG